MSNLPEELIYVLVFGAIALFQYLMKRFGPQEEPLPPQALDDAFDPELEAWEMEQEAPLAQVVPAYPTGDARLGARVTPPAPRPRRFSRKSLMGSQRDVQNAVVIATILGPCRAFEPHDIR
ncbi:MAG: hypothetical protein Q8O33_00095 [Pseudomonadota bacterium]|nr:hypothetical protein [Pseudomonadota bacterium]